jgi:hypothetical protein
MKIIIANTNVQALLKATDSILDKCGRDDVPENIKGQATLSALKTQFGNRFFSVCNLQKMAEMNGVTIPREKEAFFNTLHCVDFADMTQETRDYLFATLVDLFRGNIAMANTNYELTN